MLGVRICMRSVKLLSLVILSTLIFTIAAEFYFGPLRCAYIQWNSGFLLTSGSRHKYVMALSNSGIIGKMMARSYIINTFKHNKHYGKYFLVTHKKLWVGYSKEKFHSILGTPDKFDAESDQWVVINKSNSLPDEDYYKCYIIVEYEASGLFRGIGLNGKSPADDYIDKSP